MHTSSWTNCCVLPTHLLVMLHTSTSLLGVSPHVQRGASLSEPRGARKLRDNEVCVMHVSHEAPSCPLPQAQTVGGGGQATANNLEDQLSTRLEGVMKPSYNQQ